MGRDLLNIPELPDSGGYILNGVQIPENQIEREVRAILARQPPTARAVIVWDNPRRAWKDFEFIDEAAKKIGGRAYDAERSGWPKMLATPLDSLE